MCKSPCQRKTGPPGPQETSRRGGQPAVVVVNKIKLRNFKRFKLNTRECLKKIL